MIIMKHVEFYQVAQHQADPFRSHDQHHTNNLLCVQHRSLSALQVHLAQNQRQE